jgi:hypothetical protein
VIDAAIDHSRPLEFPPVAGLFYRAFTDAAGGVGRDAYTLAIAHVEANRFVVDAIRGTTGRFDPQAITEDYSRVPHGAPSFVEIIGFSTPAPRNRHRSVEN